MLHWCDAPGGWRPSDKRLRDAYPAARSSVLSPNGLYGSMGIGGMALALRLREQWPKILLNETHPKVLAFALRHERHTDIDPTAAINDHHPRIYVLRCGTCGHENGANGSDIFQRKCPRHDGGAPRLTY